jgi:hypothetical protein
MNLDSVWRRGQLISSSSSSLINTSEDALNAVTKDSSSDFYRFLFADVNTNAQEGKDKSTLKQPSVSLSLSDSTSSAHAPIQSTSLSNHESRLLSLLLGLLTINWHLESKWMQRRCEGLIDVWSIASSSDDNIADNRREGAESTGRYTARVTLSTKAPSLKSTYDALRSSDVSTSANAPATPSTPFLFNIFSSSSSNAGNAASDFIAAARGSPIAYSPLSKLSSSQQPPLLNANSASQRTHVKPFAPLSRSSTGNSQEVEREGGGGGGESKLLQWRPTSLTQANGGSKEREEAISSSTSSSQVVKTAPDVTDCLDLLQDLAVASKRRQTKIKALEGEKDKKKRVELLEMGEIDLF